MRHILRQSIVMVCGASITRSRLLHRAESPRFPDSMARRTCSTSHAGQLWRRDVSSLFSSHQFSGATGLAFLKQKVDHTWVNPHGTLHLSQFSGSLRKFRSHLAATRRSSGLGQTWWSSEAGTNKTTQKKKNHFYTYCWYLLIVCRSVMDQLEKAGSVRWLIRCIVFWCLHIYIVCMVQVVMNSESACSTCNAPKSYRDKMSSNH